MTLFFNLLLFAFPSYHVASRLYAGLNNGRDSTWFTFTDVLKSQTLPGSFSQITGLRNCIPVSSYNVYVCEKWVWFEGRFSGFWFYWLIKGERWYGFLLILVMGRFERSDWGWAKMTNFCFGKRCFSLKKAGPFVRRAKKGGRPFVKT